MKKFLFTINSVLFTCFIFGQFDVISSFDKEMPFNTAESRIAAVGNNYYFTLYNKDIMKYELWYTNGSKYGPRIFEENVNVSRMYSIEGRLYY